MKKKGKEALRPDINECIGCQAIPFALFAFGALKASFKLAKLVLSTLSLSLSLSLWY